MTARDPIAAARAIAAERFPAAVWVWLTGSVLTPRRTPGSDLDLLVICHPADLPVPYRESAYLHGFPVELFVNTAAGLDDYLARDGRRPILHRMIADAVVVAGDGHAAHPIQARCRQVLDAGPPPLTPAQRDRARYGLTDALDDLAHATDPTEVACLKADVWRDTALLFLQLRRHWIGAGKWLAREVVDCDPGFAGYRETRDTTLNTTACAGSGEGDRADD